MSGAWILLFCILSFEMAWNILCFTVFGVNPKRKAKALRSLISLAKCWPNSVSQFNATCGLLWIAGIWFFNFLTDHSFDWVTKAKRNTALYRKEIESWSGRERYVPLNARMLIKEVFPRLMVQGSGLASVSIPNIYIKLPYQTTGKQGKTATLLSQQSLLCVLKKI